ncbi:MAG: flavodoxin [Legionellales bacterium]|nr:flavodoxin [Legionellales bacterium]|tara:strand:- start:83 stop:658 length:576 start_codon:yes stop_codon:yes gene_type:complete
MTSVAIIYHSGFGHTQKQAEAILKGVLSVPNIQVELLPVDEAYNKIKELHEFDGMIFGTPTYMGSVSAEFKKFMDLSSSEWFVNAWKDKLAGGFTNSASLSGDKFSSLMQLITFAAQHGMLWLPLGLSNESAPLDRISGDVNAINRLGASLGAVAQSENDSPDVTPTGGDLKTAELFGERFAMAAIRWTES